MTRPSRQERVLIILSNGDMPNLNMSAMQIFSKIEVHGYTTYPTVSFPFHLMSAQVAVVQQAQRSMLSVHVQGSLPVQRARGTVQFSVDR